jgi:hypothetical protein
MMKKKKNSEDPDMGRKILLVKNILNEVYEIIALFRPLLELSMELEEAQIYKKNGTLERVASLFGDIAENCKELERQYLIS